MSWWVSPAPHLRGGPPHYCRQDGTAPMVVGGWGCCCERGGRQGEAKLSPSRPALPRHRRAEVSAPGRAWPGQPLKPRGESLEGRLGKQFVNIHSGGSSLPWVFSVATAGRRQRHHPPSSTTPEPGRGGLGLAHPFLRDAGQLTSVSGPWLSLAQHQGL